MLVSQGRRRRVGRDPSSPGNHRILPNSLTTFPISKAKSRPEEVLSLAVHTYVLSFLEAESTTSAVFSKAPSTVETWMTSWNATEAQDDKNK